jgi:alkanesulfonate monooxygenase SsuD/methylene tetrahydromethanopterin reductase-like flavin-dependent oxidoreductase (luciferase family)
MQKPYPRVWIPGVLSKETVIWTAQQRYPYIALNTAIDATKVIWDTYSKAAAEVGYTAGPENFGYLIRVHVQDTEEKAMQNARQFMWMQGEFTGLAHPVWANPSGYFSPSGRRGFVEFAVGRAKNPRGNPTFEQQVADTMIICGTPDTVIPRLKHLIEHTRPGIMGIWGNDGTVPAADRRRCIELLVKEVMPAVKEHGKTLGLKDPWEANAPVHLRYSTDIPVQKAAAE